MLSATFSIVGCARIVNYLRSYIAICRDAIYRVRIVLMRRGSGRDKSRPYTWTERLDAITHYGSVNNSGAPSVMAMECSNCAERLPSAVQTVQRSASTLAW